MTKRIRRIHPKTGEEVIFNSIEDAVANTVSISNRSFGTRVDKANVSLCVNGKLKFAAGYMWEKVAEGKIPGEVWKPFPGSTEIMVSTHGRVQERGIFRPPLLDKSGGNAKVFINKKTFLLWKVVLAVFHPYGARITTKSKVKFLDGNKHNCSVANLEIVKL